ncbi:EamA family transporter [Leifsonia sp. YAF41]|uniref:EamA family transporter n=1 Tax=Leifsonia sp. YAF41 TaxID=3233086 RepID=UPI003F99707A
MIPLALALSAALTYGVSDFTAGLAARRAHFLWVTLASIVVALIMVAATLPWTSPTLPNPDAVEWGALSGLGTAIGSLALYRGFSRGEMSVAGPISAVGAAVLPALVGVAIGDRLPPLAIAGVIVALPAIWLVSRASSHDGAPFRAGALDGCIAGLGFGVLFIGLNRAGNQDGLWPVAAGQAAALLVIGITIAFTQPTRPTRSAKIGWLVLATGALGVAGTVSYFYASQLGILTLAAVVTSLYPAITVLLAFLLLHERPNRTQLIGLALCGVAVVGIAAS